MKTYKLDDYKNYESYHRELWTWLSQNVDKSKSDWFDKYWKGKRPSSECFACVVAETLLDELKRQNIAIEDFETCGHYCPIANCGDFEVYIYSDTDDLRKTAAVRLANKPWNREKFNKFLEVVKLE